LSLPEYTPLFPIARAGPKPILLALKNVGIGKTEENIRFIAEHPLDRVLVIVPDYRNVQEYRTRLAERDVISNVFRGKGPYGSEERGDFHEGLCQQPEGEQYVPGCKACSHFPEKNHEGCPYLEQYPEKNEWRVVLTTSHSLHAAYTGVPFDWIVIDESVEGILYSVLEFSREDYRVMGIEWDVFPEPVARKCDATCPLYDKCIDRTKKRMKKEGLCKGHSMILTMTPTITREPENDWEYFLHKSLKDVDGDVVNRTGCWDFFYNRPNVLLFGFLPEFPVTKGIRFASATVTEQMAREWFFANYCDGWDFVPDRVQLPFENEVRVTRKRGSRKTALRALRDGTLEEMLNETDIVPDKALLIVCVKKQESAFKRGFPNAFVDHFPLCGLDCYRDVKNILITTPFRYSQSIRYLLADKIGWGMVRALESGWEMQAIGRIRPYQSPEKLIITYFDFEHELFPNTSTQREMRTEEWVKQYLTDDPSLSTNQLFAMAQNVGRDLALKNRNGFVEIVKRIRTTLPIPISECPPIPDKFCLLNYLTDPKTVKKGDLRKVKDGGLGLFGKFMGLWQLRRTKYNPDDFDATLPYFIATGRQPKTGKRGIKEGKNLAVIDLDGKGDHRAWLTERHMPSTMAVRTGSGGTQLYYYLPSVVPNGAHLVGTCGFTNTDIRGDGGIVFGPGTHWADKQEYTIIEGGFDTIASVSESQFWAAVNVEEVEIEVAGKKKKVIQPRKAKIWNGTHKGRSVPFTDPFPPCIQTALKYLTGELVDTSHDGMAHGKRVFLASYLLKMHWSQEKVIAIFRPAKDFDLEETRYQVASCAKLKHVHACSTVEFMNLCTPTCPHCSPPPA